MRSMRVLVTIFALAAAAPAAAQVPGPLDQMQLDTQRMQQESLARRLIDQQNQLMAAEAQARADRAVLELRLQRDLPVRAPEPPPAATPAAANAPPAAFPSVPDAALADPNRKVQAATHERR